MDAVDPQLKNNSDLVLVLECYEKSWAFGKEWLISVEKQNQIIAFTMSLELLSKRHPQLSKQIDARDSEIFVSIPQLMILLSI